MGVKTYKILGSLICLTIIFAPAGVVIMVLADILAELEKINAKGV